MRVINTLNIMFFSIPQLFIITFHSSAFKI